MSVVLEVNGENAFKSKEDILAFNMKNFPKVVEDRTEIGESGEDPMSNLRSQMKKRIYTFNKREKESSSMKVAEFRDKFAGIKSRIDYARTERHSTVERPNYVSIMQALQNDADLITNIEGTVLLM